MSQISEIQSNLGTTPVQPSPSLQARADAPPAVEPPADRVEISEAGQRLAAGELLDFRMDKVAEVRAAIARGDYDTPEVIDQTVERLILDL